MNDTKWLKLQSAIKKLPFPPPYIEKQIQALPAKMRHVFELSRKENLSNKEIAARLNTTESNISKHIIGAVRILRTKLGLLFTFILF